MIIFDGTDSTEDPEFWRKPMHDALVAIQENSPSTQR
jgi:hypothetical protein